MTVAIAIYNTEGSHLKKICLYLDFFQTTLTPVPPPLCFWNPLRNFFKTFFVPIKVPQSVWIFVILQHFPWIMSKPKQKKVTHHLWNPVPPPLPPYLKISKLIRKVPQTFWNQATSPPPLPSKCPNSRREVPPKVWNREPPPPPSEKCPNMNRTKRSSKSLDWDMTPPPSFGKIPNRSRFFFRGLPLSWSYSYGYGYGYGYSFITFTNWIMSVPWLESGSTGKYQHSVSGVPSGCALGNSLDLMLVFPCTPLLSSRYRLSIRENVHFS